MTQLNQTILYGPIGQMIVNASSIIIYIFVIITLIICTANFILWGIEDHEPAWLIPIGITIFISILATIFSLGL